jgi:hypothetical protein
MSFKILVAGFRLEPVKFSRDQMARIGAVQVQAQRERIEGGQNVYDMPARPLNPAYAKQKRQAGAQPIRNMRLTGATLDAMKVESEDNQATVEFASDTAERRAYLSNSIDPMFGISPTDAVKTGAAAGLEFPAAVKASINKP